MSEKKKDTGSTPNLPDLPDSAELTELEPLADLPELPELPGMPEESAAPRETPAPEPPADPSPIEDLPAESVADALGVELDEPLADPASEAPADPVDGPDEDLPEEPTPKEPAVIPESPPAPASGVKPPLRELENAVKHLRLAAKIVVVGCLLPFMQFTSVGASADVWFSLGAKLVGLVGAWLWYRQVLHNWGPKVPGILGKLADINLKPEPKEDEKPKRRTRGPAVAAIEHPFPTALHIVSLLVLCGGIVLCLEDPRSGRAGPVGLAEYLMLTWAAMTFVHIGAYERWGKFNPLFSLLFLGMLFAGLASAFGALGAEGLWKPMGLVGGGLVGLGGGLAAYTIVEAMVQAKKEGDIKKAAAIEARKAARKSKKK